MNTSQKPQLPDFYVPHAEVDAKCDVILQKINKPIRPGKDKVIAVDVKDKAWIVKYQSLQWRYSDIGWLQF